MTKIIGIQQTHKELKDTTKPQAKQTTQKNLRNTTKFLQTTTNTPKRTRNATKILGIQYTHEDTLVAR